MLQRRKIPCSRCIHTAGQTRADRIYSVYVIRSGRKPYVVNLARVVRQNNTFRTALWTGDHLQLTIMSIKPGMILVWKFTLTMTR